MCATVFAVLLTFIQFQSHPAVQDFLESSWFKDTKPSPQELKRLSSVIFTGLSLNGIALNPAIQEAPILRFFRERTQYLGKVVCLTRIPAYCIG